MTILIVIEKRIIFLPKSVRKKRQTKDSLPEGRNL